jgi:hypothetical protein
VVAAIFRMQKMTVIFATVFSRVVVSFMRRRMRSCDVGG